jgi:hypothetical protein
MIEALLDWLSQVIDRTPESDAYRAGGSLPGF